MNKKKAIKLVTATALAASSFAAVAPFNTEAAVNVAGYVKAATDSASKAFHAYYDVSLKGQAASVATVQAVVKSAQTKYQAAKKVVSSYKGKDKSVYLAKLDAASKSITLAQNYINAVKLADSVNAQANKLQASALDSKSIQKTLPAFLTSLTTADKKVKDLVSGSKAENLVIKSYLNAKTVAPVLDAYNWAYKASYWVKQDNLKNADFDLKKADELLKGATSTDLVKAVSSYVDQVKAQYEVKLAPVVESVSAIDATRLQVTFNKAVDPATVFANGTDGTLANGFVATLNALDNQGAVTVTSATLSADKKSIVLTVSANLSQRYDVKVDGVKTADGVAFPTYKDVNTFAVDTVAPKIVGTEQLSSTKVKVSFSEPVHAFPNASISFKYADGSTVTGITGDVAEGATSVTFTLGNGVTAGKSVTATFVGLQDKANNIVSPNPSSVVLVKGTPDGILPVVSSITQTSASTFAVKFSKALSADPTVTVSGYTNTVAVDSNDSTVYNVTTNAPLDGIQTVTVSNFSDNDLQAGATTSKFVTFTKDIAAPTVASTAVVTDSKDGLQYLEITFNKDVLLSTPKVSATGSYVKDYVTTPVTVAPTTIGYKDLTGTNKKVVRVSLASLLGANAVTGLPYSLTLSFTGLTSTALVPVSSTTNVTITRGTDTPVTTNTTKLAAPTVVQSTTDNNKIIVTFAGPVDGASATNPGNYVIDGAIVDSVSLAPSTGGTQVATLNVNPGSVKFSGIRNITISNVKALNSTVTMDSHLYNDVTLNENIAPTITGVAVSALTDATTGSTPTPASSVITLTASEALNLHNASGENAQDFDLYIGGNKVTTAGVTVATAFAKDTLGADITNKVEVTISGYKLTATDFANGIQLRPETATQTTSAIDITDAKGNALNTGAINVTLQ